MVKEELKKIGLHHVIVDLGVVEILEDITPVQFDLLKKNLAMSGLELLDDKKAILIEKIKDVIIEMVHYTDELPKVNYSDYISDKLHQDYTYLSNIFSEVKGITIQQFIINHKIERVKELLLYDEMNLSEIAYLLNYSSVAHLSNQFRKTTGLSASEFKALHLHQLVNADGHLRPFADGDLRVPFEAKANGLQPFSARAGHASS
jgi:AraC-like DNA-binding protein